MIRKAVLKDISRINELGLLVNLKFPKLFNIKEILNEEISVIYVYEEENDILGFLHATVLYETVDIINIVVDKDHRRKKIGSLLLDYLISDMPKEVKLYTLEVNVNNEAAINLYKNFGFEVVRERKHYYNNESAYVMGRSIS